MFTEPLFDFESYRHLSAGAKRTARAAHPLGIVENDLTRLIGAEAGLEVNRTLFAAALPHPVESGLAVRLVGETPRQVDFSRRFEFRIAARHPDDAVLRAWFDAILGVLPIAGSAPDSLRVWLEIAASGPLELTTGANRGRTVAIGKLPLTAELLTVPAESR